MEKSPTVNPLWYPMARVATEDTFSAGGSITTNREKNVWQGAAGGVFNIYTGVYDYLSGMNVLTSSAAATPALTNQNLEKYGFDWGYEALDRQYNKQGGFQSQEYDDFEIGNVRELTKFGFFPSAGQGVSMVGLPEVPAPNGMESAMKIAGSTKWQEDLRPRDRGTNNIPIGKIAYVRQVNRNSSINNPRIR